MGGPIGAFHRLTLLRWTTTEEQPSARLRRRLSARMGPYDSGESPLVMRYESVRTSAMPGQDNANLGYHCTHCPAEVSIACHANLPKKDNAAMLTSGPFMT
jgi:hypothetical protein